MSRSLFYCSLRRLGLRTTTKYRSTPPEATPKSVTMVEIHSNFTVDGSKQVINGVAPSNHAMHETLEITYGWTDWFETGFYVFSSIQPNDGWIGWAITFVHG